jgi:hypothetical protein
MARRCALLAAAAVFIAAPAVAEPSAPEKAMASQLFDDAEKAMADGNVGQACPKYAESQRLDPQLGTLLHLGECYARAERSASAWASFKDALEIAVARSDSREPRIRRRVAELEKILSRLVIKVPESAPADLEIRQDGNVVGRPVWGTPLPIDAGSHTVTASAAGMKPWTGSVQVAAGSSTAQVTIPPLEAEPEPAAIAAVAAPATAAAGPVPSSGEAAASSTSNGSIQRILGWTAVGAGVGGLTVGIVYNVIRSDKLEQRDKLCPMNECANEDQKNRVESLTQDAKNASTISMVGFIAGGVFVAGGLVLVLTAPRGDAKVTGVSAIPLVARDFQGIAVTGRLW